MKSNSKRQKRVSQKMSQKKVIVFSIIVFSIFLSLVSLNFILTQQHSNFITGAVIGILPTEEYTPSENTTGIDLPNIIIPDPSNEETEIPSHQNNENTEQPNDSEMGTENVVPENNTSTFSPQGFTIQAVPSLDTLVLNTTNPT